MSSTIYPTTQPAGARVPLSRLARAGVITVVTAIVANLVARALLFVIVPLDPAFPPLTPGAIAIFTAIGVGLGAVVFAVIARRAARPVRTFRIVAVVALIVSILPNLASMANPTAMPFPGGTAAAFAALIVFHVVAGVIAIFLLPALARAKS